MVRTLFTLVAAASAVLCALALLAWPYTGVAAAGHRLALEFQRPDGRWELAAERGRLRLGNGPQVKWEREDRARVKQLLFEAEYLVVMRSAEISESRQQYAIAKDDD